MIAVSYIMKRKIKKIFLEVISNFKILNIHFFSTKLSTTKIFPNLQGGTKQRGGTGQRRIRYKMNYTC